MMFAESLAESRSGYRSGRLAGERHNAVATRRRPQVAADAIGSARVRWDWLAPAVAAGVLSVPARSRRDVGVSYGEVQRQSTSHPSDTEDAAVGSPSAIRSALSVLI